MIYIYELIKKNNEITNELIDIWDNGKFKNSSKKMNRNEVINIFNSGYNFTSETKPDQQSQDATREKLQNEIANYERN